MKRRLQYLFLITITISAVFLCFGGQAGAAWVCPDGGSAHNSSNINKSPDTLYVNSDCTGVSWTGDSTGNPVALGGAITTITGYQCSPYQIGNCYNFAWIGSYASYKVGGTGACVVGYRSIFGNYLGQCTWQYEKPTLTINDLSNSVFASGDTVRVDGKTFYPNAQEYFFYYKLDANAWTNQNYAYNGVSDGWDWWFTFPSLSLGWHTVSVKTVDEVGESNTVATTFLVNTTPSITTAAAQTSDNGSSSTAMTNGYVKNDNKLYVNGTITDPDTQNFTVSYSLSTTTTPSTWTVCRSASSTRMGSSACGATILLNLTT